MIVASYLAQSLGWTAVGFLGGYLAGHAARDVQRIADAVTGEDTMQRKPRIPRISSQTVVAIVVVVLGILTVIQGLVQSAATDRLTQCQADYSNDFADALDARSQASTDAQEALDDLMSTVGGALRGNAVDRAAVQHAIADYLAKREAVKRQQQAHPYPPPPRAVCP
ncbi:hypothetical protein [Labedaea rhizosphaerae]|uniref:Uncharacterized protein n=1 Tax=Labedaea rhizosphaerae TaxID=598644 RepID=A0A4R6SHF7_LABRH|nr:hypothetical protein [Labedaea rhizosphaerae]TDQ01234.1 hypothetical protein EV186_1021102 [Labedaea rhizosphaerae]